MLGSHRVVLPPVVGVTKLKNDLSLTRVGELRIVQVGSVHLLSWRLGEAASHRVILEVEHGRASRRILIHDLLDEQEEGGLMGLRHVNLHDRKSLDESIDGIDRDLFALVEDKIKTFE